MSKLKAPGHLDVKYYLGFLFQSKAATIKIMIRALRRIQIRFQLLLIPILYINIHTCTYVHVSNVMIYFGKRMHVDFISFNFELIYKMKQKYTSLNRVLYACLLAESMIITVQEHA